MIVVMIVGIISLIAIPIMNSAAGLQVKTASDMIASDLEYTQNLAITNGSTYSVVFDTAAESYKIIDSENNIIKNPSKPGIDYIVNFTSDPRLNKVKLESAFGSKSKVQFDNLGSPDNGGAVVIKAEGNTLIVNVQPVTGYVSIQ
jgi:Tfp pilus assembly protein FimT